MKLNQLFGITKNVPDNQRSLVFEDNKLTRVLTPGNYRLWDINKQLDFTDLDIDSLYFSARNTERLYKANPMLHEHIAHYQLDKFEVGFAVFERQLTRCGRPGRTTVFVQRCW